ncbi:MAG: Iron-sulfur cluster carrier protein [Phycisphaerae bacterium]|nr:Iron-sulfur cluster carrier protein [Phycisphaerae bacterium]
MSNERIKEQITDALRGVMDPELHQDIVKLKMVKSVAVCDGAVRVEIELTTPACPLKDVIRKDVERAVRGVAGVTQVMVEFSASVRPSSGPLADALPGVKNVLAVGAGKGGVGKSTVAVAAAVGLLRDGATVGLLDGDIYGPSIPTMLGLGDAQPRVKNERILPIEWRLPGSQSVLKVISIGFMIDPDKALIWRGPMVHGVMRQFLGQVDWGELDYLVIDLPPGTGDVPLTLAQSVPLTGAVVVCTPQEVALIDARRAVRMFRDVGVECLGMVENMSYYACPHCGKEDDIFGRGGAKQSADRLNVPFLGEIPINGVIRAAGDEGRPERLFEHERTGQAFSEMVRNLAGQITVRNLTKPPPRAIGQPDQQGRNAANAPGHKPIGIG